MGLGFRPAVKRGRGAASTVVKAGLADLKAPDYRRKLRGFCYERRAIGSLLAGLVNAENQGGVAYGLLKRNIPRGGKVMGLGR